MISNPMDLHYRVQNVVVGDKQKIFREAADPSVVRFEGRYYLFPSMSGGFWHSSDLTGWEFVATPELPVYDYAPDVREVDGQLIVCASRRGKKCDFYRTSDPLAGRWETIPGEVAFWDPNLFQDDDGRLYLYEGCSANTPIRGIELDRTTLRRIGKRADLIRGNAKDHGWEVSGIDFDPEKFERSMLLRIFFGKRPFIEGAWMTKHDGRYYLQYSAPDTTLNAYSDGYYVGDSPLGPFRYAEHSPFSSKPGGFIQAAGHGSTFQDEHGNWWHIASMRIAVHHDWERRLGLFPAGFDEDGVMFCNQEFADYPFAIPNGPVDPWSLTGSQMLISEGAQVRASSAAPGHPAGNAVTEDIQTWWTAATRNAGEWLSLELPAGSVVSAIQVNTVEHDAVLPKPASGAGNKNELGHRLSDPTDTPAPFLLEISDDGVEWEVLRDGRNDGRSHDFTELREPRVLRHVRVTGGTPALGSSFSISGLRVFGVGAGDPPAAARATARRVSPLEARIDWSPVDGATGYNVRYGAAADKLYSCWQVGATPGLDLRSLNAGVDYWVAVDSFNSAGVTRGETLRVRGKGTNRG